MSSTSTEHLRCFPLFCLYFCLQKPSPPYLLRLSCSPLPRLVPLPHPPSTHPTSHFPLTVFVSLIADERQKFVRAQDLYSAFMCRSTLHRWEPFKPKVIHACICMRKRGARRPRQDCSMLYMHTYFPPLVLFFDTCPRVWADRKKKKKSTYRRCTCEIRLIQRHYHESIFHTYIFICSYLKTDFSFVSILTHFTPYYHTYHALLEVFIYQSTLDWAFFFCLFGWADLTQICDFYRDKPSNSLSSLFSCAFQTLWKILHVQEQTSSPTLCCSHPPGVQQHVCFSALVWITDRSIVAHVSVLVPIVNAQHFSGAGAKLKFESALAPPPSSCCLSLSPPTISS